MLDLGLILLIVVAWVLLNRYVLPWFGVHT